MSTANSKDMRKAVRNVAQELLTGMVKEEAYKSIEAQLTKKFEARLDALSKHINGVLADVESRSKDTQSMLIRAIAANQPTPKDSEVKV